MAEETKPTTPDAPPPAAGESASATLAGGEGTTILAISRHWRDLEVFRETRVGVLETRPQRRRLRRMFFVLGLALALLGIMAGLVSWISAVPMPYFVPLFITEYESRLIPINAQANPDREALRVGAYFPRTDENAFASQERHLLIQDLAGLKNRNSRATVVYLSALAASIDGGDVMLYPADARPDNPASRLSLRQVLKQIYDCPAPRKLLVLDIMRPVAHARIGVLENDVAAAVKEVVQQELTRVPDPQELGLILCSCSPGQVSLNSEDLSRSVFNYYLEEGLRGWAEGYDNIDDSRVSVSELVEFVTRRVDRWAIRNRNTRQTPMLLGVPPAGKFQVATLTRGRAQPHRDLPEIADYPSWLLDGWKLRDLWAADPRFQIDPRILQQLAATMLRSELEWRGGVDATRVQNDLKDRVEQFKTQAALAQSLIPAPSPRSLALAALHGQKPDPSVTKDLQDLLTTIAQQKRDMKPEDADKAKPKLEQAFFDKIKAKTHFDLAWAAFEVATEETNPARETIQFLDRLLIRQQPQPRYVETLFLHRLAGLADQLTANAWPAQTVRRALDVVAKGEQAIVQPRVLPWIRGALSEAAQTRYNAEVLLFARGYAPLDTVDQLLAKAGDAYDLLLSHEQTILRAYSLRDQAFAFLPYYAPYLEAFPANEKVWRLAIEAAIDLDNTLNPPAATAVPSAASLRQQGELLRQKADTVRNRLDDLRWPFEAERLASLMNQSRQPEATPAVCQSIDAILTTPNLRANDRVALWRASRELSHRLLEQTVEIDQDEDNRKTQTPPQADYEFERSRFERKQQELAALRARIALGVLELGGFAAEPLHKLRDELNGKADANSPPVAPSRSFAQALRQAWSEQLPEQIQQATDIRVQDRLSRIVPAFDVVPQVDEARTNPAVARQAEMARDLWAWLVEFYRYESRDMEGSSFYAEAAIEYQRQAVPTPETFLHVEGCSQLPSLTAFTPTANCSLRLSLFNPLKKKLQVSLEIVTADDEWLQVRADTQAMPGLLNTKLRTNACLVPLHVELKPGAEFSRLPKPQGFLVLVRVAGRTYHHRVSIPSLPQSLVERVEGLLSADPAGPSDPISNLRLRPIKAQQLYYLYVRNTTPKPRNVIVQLRNGGGVLRGGETKLTVGVNETKAVKFPLPLPAAGAPTAAPAGTPAAPAIPVQLPELDGPLGIRLIDADKPDAEFLDEKIIPVNIASPREYVQVSEIQFSPPSPKTGGKNRLLVRLKAIANISGPPCVVELALPAKRIPGFISAKDGNFRGAIPPPGEELLLYANNILLEEGTPLDGYVYLNVDGMERAFIFRTTFARQGDPTTPQLDDRPAIRLRAEPFALSSSKYVVGVETDNPPPNASIEMTLSQVEGTFETDITKKVPEARHRHLGFTPFGPEGALQFEASIEDLSVPLNTAGIRGRRELRVFLFDRTGAEVDEASMVVVFDDSPPDMLRFFDVPVQVRKDQPLLVKATGADNESGIAKVNFFLGKAVDGKLPPTAMPVEGVPITGAPNEWMAKLQLTPTLKGPIDVSVQFINGVGLSSFATTTVEVSDGDMKGPGRIAGVVLEGGRPQEGLTVVMHDPKEKTADKDQKAVTKADGSFEFDNVAPGSYTLGCSKVASGRTGTATVVVLPNQTAQASIMLLK